jgi:hypothetical protein
MHLRESSACCALARCLLDRVAALPIQSWFFSNATSIP